MNKFRVVTSVSLLVIAQLLLLLPLLLYGLNRAEFSSGFLDIIRHLALPALAVTCVLIAAGTLLPGKLHSGFVLLLLWLGVGLYLQSAWLVWDYGQFDGADIAWQDLAWRGWIDLGVWAALLLACLVFSRPLYASAGKICLVLLAIQAFNALSLLKQPDFSWQVAHKSQRLDSAFEFSTDKNVILIILDAFQAPAFKDIVDKDEHFRGVFSDFVFYRNMLSSFPTTAPSLPALLTGQTFEHKTPLAHFTQKIGRERWLPSMMKANGFHTVTMTLSQFCSNMETDLCGWLDYFTAQNHVKTERKQLVQLLDVTLFRALPQVLKRQIYNEQAWLLQSLTTPVKRARIHAESLDFVDLLERQSRTGLDKPGFKIFHTMVPHRPLGLDAECRMRWDKKSRRVNPANYDLQARCALSMAERMLDTFRRIGVYDNSLIVISADHGAAPNMGYHGKKEGIPNLSIALPLLLVKDFGRQGQSEVSEVPGSTSDIAKTILDMAGVPGYAGGQSLVRMQPGQQRVRRFLNYHWEHTLWQSGELPPMQEFIVDGHAWDAQAWQRGQAIGAWQQGSDGNGNEH